jgi:hypothetical protein
MANFALALILIARVSAPVSADEIFMGVSMGKAETNEKEQNANFFRCYFMPMEFRLRSCSCGMPDARNTTFQQL